MPISVSSNRSASDVSASRYAPESFEGRWQARWEAEGLHRALNPGDPGFDPEAKKYYVLDMFPYPSGAGLHVGHPIGYIGTDIIARKKRMEGYNVLHPMGYDAFGLPAEQYAIQTGQHPEATTDKNIATFRKQLQSIGLSFDWSRELKTCDPRFYKWTQWIFARLFERGYAYQQEVAVWWCEELKTVLANEEVIQGKSERGGFPCERRPLKQWMLKITAFADRLIDDLELVNWPESVKAMQREWIGRSHGASIRFGVDDHPGALVEVFTTRPDTLFGATFMVLAPEHALVAAITTESQRAAVNAYIAEAKVKSDLERTDLAKGKSGVFTGAYALNPLIDPADPAARIPIWIADYVLVSYGTGAIMAVPGHDTRDFEFAGTFGLEIVEVVEPPAGTPGLADGECFHGQGTAVNSGPLNGLSTADAKARVIELLGKHGSGEARTNYSLRDWLFSRQRYWGEPFPIVHSDAGTKRVPDADLPVELPAMDDFTPSADGSAPLGRAKDWVQTTDPDTGGPALRETDTMPGWAGSCWYYLRFMDPTNDAAPFGEDVENYWGSVDLYVGGTEHAVLHLLYARFWHKFLFDEGLVSTPEPFSELFNQGMLTAFAYKDATGRLVPSDEVALDGDQATSMVDGAPLERVIAKMSKSLKNVVNPDDVIAEHGVDTFRVYEMFMGPLGESKPWNPRDVTGSRRFLEKVWRLFIDPAGDGSVRDSLQSAGPLNPELERGLHKMLDRVNQSFDGLNFNTAIAAMMTFVNEAQKNIDALDRNQAERFLIILSPFAPHIADELWSRLGHTECLRFAQWPVVDEALLTGDTVEIVVQVMGKLRAKVTVPIAATEDVVLAEAAAAVPDWLADKTILKQIYVPGRLVNFVVR